MYIHEFLNSQVSGVLLPSLPNVLVGRGAKLLATELEGNLDIGDFACVNRSYLEQGCGIGVSTYIGDTHVGRYAMIGSRVSIGGFEHPTSWLSMAAFQWGQSTSHWNFAESTQESLRRNVKPSYQHTHLEADVWVGNNAVVLSGLSLGVGCVIGAGSIVTKDVAPYAVVVGNPARVIRFRFDSVTINRLLESRWWRLPFEFISNLPFDQVDKCLEKIERYRQQHNLA